MATTTRERINAYKAAIAEAASKGIEHPEFVTPKPRPVDEECFTYATCGKCGGTGKYSMGVMNGRPYSLTGFVCLSCRGLGYRPRKRRAALAKAQGGAQ